MAVQQVKPEIIESSEVISDNVVKQTQLVEKSDIEKAITAAKMNVGILKIRLELLCYHAGFVVESTELNLAMVGP